MNRMGSIRRQTRCGLVILGLLALARLDAANIEGALSMEEAINRTLARNPDLMALGHQIEAQQGRVAQSGIGPAAELALDVENVLGTAGFRGIGAGEETLSLSWVLERGKRQNHVAAARAGLSIVEAEMEIRRLDAATLSALLYLDNLELQERYAISLQAIEAAEAAVAMLGQGMETGLATAGDLARARADLAVARLHSVDAKHDLSAARHALAMQWGQVKPDFPGVSGDWRRLPLPGTIEALLEQLDAAPDMAAYANRRRLREAEIRLAESEARPDWSISTGIRRLEEDDDYAFTFGFAAPFGGAGRNRGQVREARANLAQLDAERTAARARIEAQLLAIHQEMEHSLLRAEMLRDELLPRLREAAEHARKGHEAGDDGILDLQALELEKLSVQSELVQAVIDARRQQIEIERLIGAAMPPAA